MDREELAKLIKDFTEWVTRYYNYEAREEVWEEIGNIRHQLKLSDLIEEWMGYRDL